MSEGESKEMTVVLTGVVDIKILDLASGVPQPPSRHPYGINIKILVFQASVL